MSKDKTIVFTDDSGLYTLTTTYTSIGGQEKTVLRLIWVDPETEKETIVFDSRNEIPDFRTKIHSVENGYGLQVTIRIPKVEGIPEEHRPTKVNVQIDNVVKSGNYYFSAGGDYQTEIHFDNLTFKEEPFVLERVWNITEREDPNNNIIWEDFEGKRQEEGQWINALPWERSLTRQNLPIPSIENINYNVGIIEPDLTFDINNLISPVYQTIKTDLEINGSSETIFEGQAILDGEENVINNIINIDLAEKISPITLNRAFWYNLKIRNIPLIPNDPFHYNPSSLRQEKIMFLDIPTFSGVSTTHAAISLNINNQMNNHGISEDRPFFRSEIRFKEQGESYDDWITAISQTNSQVETTYTSDIALNDGKNYDFELRNNSSNTYIFESPNNSGSIGVRLIPPTIISAKSGWDNETGDYYINTIKSRPELTNATTLNSNLMIDDSIIDTKTQNYESLNSLTFNWNDLDPNSTYKVESNHTADGLNPSVFIKTDDIEITKVNLPTPQWNSVENWSFQYVGLNLQITTIIYNNYGSIPNLWRNITTWSSLTGSGVEDLEDIRTANSIDHTINIGKDYIEEYSIRNISESNYYNHSAYVNKNLFALNNPARSSENSEENQITFILDNQYSNTADNAKIATELQYKWGSNNWSSWIPGIISNTQTTELIDFLTGLESGVLYAFKIRNTLHSTTSDTIFFPSNEIIFEIPTKPQELNINNVEFDVNAERVKINYQLQNPNKGPLQVRSGVIFNEEEPEESLNIQEEIQSEGTLNIEGEEVIPAITSGIFRNLRAIATISGVDSNPANLWIEIPMLLTHQISYSSPYGNIEGLSIDFSNDKDYFITVSGNVMNVEGAPYSVKTFSQGVAEESSQSINLGGGYSADVDYQIPSITFHSQFRQSVNPSVNIPIKFPEIPGTHSISMTSTTSKSFISFRVWNSANDKAILYYYLGAEQGEPNINIGEVNSNSLSDLIEEEVLPNTSIYITALAKYGNLKSLIYSSDMFTTQKLLTHILSHTIIRATDSEIVIGWDNENGYAIKVKGEIESQEENVNVHHQIGTKTFLTFTRTEGYVPDSSYVLENLEFTDIEDNRLLNTGDDIDITIARKLETPLFTDVEVLPSSIKFKIKNEDTETATLYWGENNSYNLFTSVSGNDSTAEQTISGLTNLKTNSRSFRAKANNINFSESIHRSINTLLTPIIVSSSSTSTSLSFEVKHSNAVGCKVTIFYDTDSITSEDFIPPNISGTITISNLNPDESYSIYVRAEPPAALYVQSPWSQEAIYSTLAVTASPLRGTSARTDTSISFNIQNQDSDAVEIRYEIADHPTAGSVKASGSNISLGPAGTAGADSHLAEATGLEPETSYWLRNLYAESTEKEKSLSLEPLKWTTLIYTADTPQLSWEVETSGSLGYKVYLTSTHKITDFADTLHATLESSSKSSSYSGDPKIATLEWNLISTGSHSITNIYNSIDGGLNSELIQQDIEFYRVRYFRHSGTILSRQAIKVGDDAIPPTGPTRTGYTFIDWDSDGKNIIEDIDIEPTYEPIEYTITYSNLHGSTNTNQTTFTIEDNVTFENPGIRTGYCFDNWTINGTPISGFSAGDYTEDITITANWTEGQTLNLPSYSSELVGDSLSISLTNDTNNSVMVNVSYELERTDELGFEPTYSSVSSGTESLSQDSTSKLDFTLSENYIYRFRYITLVNTGCYYSSSWSDYKYHYVNSQVEYTVTFYDAEGELYDQQTVLEGNPASDPSPDPSKEGHTFIEWCTDFSEVTKDLDIHPIFEINTYIISFLDYDSEIALKETVEHGSLLDPPAGLDTPENTSWEFDEWDYDFTIPITSAFSINSLWIPMPEGKFVDSYCVLDGNNEQTSTLAEVWSEGDGGVHTTTHTPHADCAIMGWVLGGTEPTTSSTTCTQLSHQGRVRCDPVTETSLGWNQVGPATTDEPQEYNEVEELPETGTVGQSVYTKTLINGTYWYQVWVWIEITTIIGYENCKTCVVIN